jgi:hypothetical protein
MNWLQAIDRSREDRAATVIKRGGLVLSTIVVEIFNDNSPKLSDCLLKVYKKDPGKEQEEYAFSPDEFAFVLAHRWGVRPDTGWEPY